MSRKKFVYKQKIIKVSLPQQQTLDRIMETGRFVSEAEVFREGLELLYRKINPPYLQPTINQEIKAEKHEKEQAFTEEELAIPDVQFVNENLQDVIIMSDDNNKQWVLFRKIGNLVGAVALDHVKDWSREKDPEFIYHQSVAGQNHIPYDTVLHDPAESALREVLKNQYGVALTP